MLYLYCDCATPWRWTREWPKHVGVTNKTVWLNVFAIVLFFLLVSARIWSVCHVTITWRADDPRDLPTSNTWNADGWCKTISCNLLSNFCRSWILVWLLIQPKHVALKPCVIQDSWFVYNLSFRRVRQSLLPWKSSTYYIFVCVCVRVRACICVGVWARGFMHVRACSVAYPACNAYAPYCDVICGPSGFTTFFPHYLI
jgi:hypothetical protein